MLSDAVPGSRRAVEALDWTGRVTPELSRRINANEGGHRPGGPERVGEAQNKWNDVRIYSSPVQIKTMSAEQKDDVVGDLLARL